MKVFNIIGKSGNAVNHQIGIIDDEGNRFFQSYNSIIVKIDNRGRTFLDANKWNYSTTTGKYRNLFLGETRKETEAKIKSGEYILCDLN